jgi:hypothetical protein
MEPTSASGAFAVLLRSLEWQPDKGPPSMAERQVWAFVQLVLPPEQPLESLWFANEDDNMMTRSVPLSAGQKLLLDRLSAGQDTGAAEDGAAGRQIGP